MRRRFARWTTAPTPSRIPAASRRNCPGVTAFWNVEKAAPLSRKSS